MTIITHHAAPDGRPACGSPSQWTTDIPAAVNCRRCLELLATDIMKRAPAKKPRRKR